MLKNLQPSHMAKICGITRQGVYKAVRTGRLLVDSNKLIICDATQNIAFAREHGFSGDVLIYPPVKKARKSKTKTGEEEERNGDEFNSNFTKLEADIQRIRTQTVKMNLDIATKMGKFILNEVVAFYFSRLTTTMTGVLVPLGARMAKDVCDELNITDTDVLFAVQKILDAEVERALFSIKKTAKEIKYDSEG